MIAAALGRAQAVITRRLGVTTLLSVFLLLLVTGNVANGLAGMINDLDTRSFELVVVGGVLFGWLLAKSPLPAWMAAPAAAVCGVGALFVQVGRLGPDVFALVKILTNHSWQAWQATKITPHTWSPIETDPLTQALQPLSEGVSALFLRARLWVEAVAAGRGAFDPIAAALVWGGGLWIVTVWAAWFVRRGDRVFTGIFPAGALYAFMLYYTSTGASGQALVWMLGAVLLLYAVRSYAANEHRWQAAQIDRVDSPWELGIAVVSITAILMLAAALAPSLSVRQIAYVVEALVAPRVGSPPPGVAESLGLPARPDPDTVFDQAKKSSLPNVKLIGSGPDLSTRPVMHVSVAGFAPFPAAAVGSASLQVPPRYYWRSFTYDQYNGRGWFTSPYGISTYLPGTAYLPAVAPQRQPVRQTVNPLADLGGFVYTAGELFSLDAKYQVAWRGENDILAVQSAARAYTAVSSIPMATESELRAAGTEYPEWVRQRYLRLPELVPARVRSLAYDITAVQPTPYEQALAIESYLRTIAYTLDVPAPPLGREVTDYFLFDLQQGYCDYFATAMVVLARSAGIPARLVTGYASGSYDPFQARFVVRESDAHSWAEAYFPGYGWVEFEPTSGLPPIDHAGQGSIPPAYSSPSPGDTTAQAAGTAGGRVDPWFLGFITLLAASAGWLAWQGVAGWQARRMPPDAFVACAYRWLYRQGRWFGLRSQPDETAGEFAECFRLRIAMVVRPERPLKEAARARRARLVGLISRDLYRLTRLYEHSLFSAQPLSLPEKAAAGEAWRSLRGCLRRAWWGGWRQLWLRK